MLVTEQYQNVSGSTLCTRACLDVKGFWVFMQCIQQFYAWTIWKADWSSLLLCSSWTSIFVAWLLGISYMNAMVRLDWYLGFEARDIGKFPNFIPFWYFHVLDYWSQESWDHVSLLEVTVTALITGRQFRSFLWSSRSLSLQHSIRGPFGVVEFIIVDAIHKTKSNKKNFTSHISNHLYVAICKAALLPVHISSKIYV